MATENNSLVPGSPLGDGGGKRTTRVKCVVTPGGENVVRLDPFKKYMLRHLAFDHAGADSLGRVKVSVANTSSAPDITVFDIEDNTEFLKADDVIYPKAGLNVIVLRAVLGTVMVQIREIERTAGSSEI